jgi:hypothetical protein
MALSFRPHFEGKDWEIDQGRHPPFVRFSNSYYCIDCINRKYAKQVKKGEAKRSAGILEIIHTDICDPFPVKSVDGFDSFITSTDDFPRYGYIYSIKKMIRSVE